MISLNRKERRERAMAEEKKEEKFRLTALSHGAG